MPSIEDEAWDPDLLLPDPRARTRKDLDAKMMREVSASVTDLKKLLKDHQIGESTRKTLGTLEDQFRELGEALAGAGREVSAGMKVMTSLAMAPHRGGWIESAGWVCERCGSESMDLDLLREVPCE